MPLTFAVAAMASPRNNTCTTAVSTATRSSKTVNINTRTHAASNNDKLKAWGSGKEYLLLLGVLGVLSSIWFVALNRAPAGLQFPWPQTGLAFWTKDSVVESTSTTATSKHFYYSNNSIEVSVLVGAELVAQSPSLEVALQSVMKPALVDAVLAVVLHSILVGVGGGGGAVPLWGLLRMGATASKGWTTVLTFSSKHMKTVKRLMLMARRTATITVSSSSRSSSSATKVLPRLWGSSKKFVQHLYKKRARYSVASELTNLVPPEPKNASKQHDNNE